jgi:hypothetical protein
MRRIRLSKESPGHARRFSGPWSPNPWINSAIVGPQKYRGVDGELRATATVEPAAEQRKERAVSTTSPVPMQCQDQQPQKAALSTWEDEGGSTAGSASR